MSRKRAQMFDALVYTLARTFVGLLGLLPIPLARRIAIGLGRVLLLLVPRLHRVGSQQIELAYGDRITPAEKRAILHGAMDNIAIFAAEFAHGPRMARLGFPTVAITGWEHVDPSRGSLLMSGHIGNWEWVAGACCQSFGRIDFIARPFNFPAMNRYIDAHRRAMGIGTIPKSGAAKGVANTLLVGGHVGLAIDQCPRESAVPVTFFGRECWATIGPVLLASRAQVPIHFLDIRRLPDLTYACEISPPIPQVNTGDKLADMVANTQACQDVLEASIRRNPGQWLWFHRRWKERPRLAEEWAARLARAQADAGAPKG